MPPPTEPPPFRPLLRQRWSHLLFLHWRFDPAVVAARLPAPLEPDCFDGSAWIAIVPFFMSRIRFVGTPAVPGFRQFPELNLRTYVRHPNGTTGVWFFSLDAAHAPAVAVGRRAFHLPYHRARIELRTEADGTIDFSAGRGELGPLRYRYRPLPVDPVRAAPDTLEHYLCERYRFFGSTGGGGAIHEGRVHHAPYALVPAEVSACDPGLFAWNGLELPERPPDHVTAAHPVDIAAPWVRRLPRPDAGARGSGSAPPG